MARFDRNASLDRLVQSAIAPIVARLSSAIAKHVARALEAELARSRSRRGHTPAASRSRPRNVEMTKWVADRRARRVPKFVIEMVGLDTKKKIVAKFGENVAFEKGKPAPKPAENGNGAAKIKAKAPTVRKKAAAA